MNTNIKDTDSKIREIKVNVRGVEKTLLFTPHTFLTKNDKGEEEIEILCDTKCPYGEGICTKLPNPEDIDNPDSSFMEFCNMIETLPEAQEKKERGWTPKKGTIETALKNCHEAYEQLFEKEHYVKLGDVIDNVCEGVCDSYSEDHAGCTPLNEFCLLKKLLRNRAKNG